MRKRMRRVLLILLLLLIGGIVARQLLRGPTIRSGSHLLLEVRGRYAEGPPPDLLGSLLHRGERRLVDLLSLIRAARVDTRIKGVLLRVGSLDVGWAMVQDIREALIEFKKSGKPLVAVLQLEASGSNKEYYLASAADRVYMSPNVTAPLNGLAASVVFLGGLWEKLDIQMDVEKIREYKTFGDMLANKEMTPAHREMTTSLLDSVQAQFITGVAQGRQLDPQRVRAVIDECPVSPAAFERAGLSDGTRYVEDLHEEIGGEQTPLVRMKDYEQVDLDALGLEVGPKLGVVYGVGAIVTGESGTGLQGDVMGADTVGQALADAASDAAVQAIVFRIDSPGGSALASDLIWRAMQEVRRKKPVIVSMGDVAASGGYYAAAGASRIVAQPATMTGSIGVVFARPNVRGLLARFGITTETISRGKFADLEDLTAPLSPEGRQKLVEEMNHIYDVFVQRVAEGRNLSRERVDEIGRGRVWTGAQAKEHGLVDELGGFMTALRAAKVAAGIDPQQEVELVYYPRRKTLLERVREQFDTGAPEIPRSWHRVLRILALPFEDGAMLTMMPQVIEVR